MLIVISGGSTTAEYLINMMLEQNHRIVVIEEDHDSIEHLAEALPPEVLLVEGDGTDSAVQLDAGVNDADLFIALMGHDDTNLVACEIAMTAFNVPRCIANVNSPKNNRIFKEVGIEPVSSTELIARMVEEEAVVGDMHMVFYASGPAFRKGYRQGSFQNQNMYLILCRLLGIEPAPNDGEWKEIKRMFRDK